MQPQQFSINGTTLFNVIDGEIFGIDGQPDFIRALHSAVKMINSDSAIRSVEIIGGHTIAKVK